MQRYQRKRVDVNQKAIVEELRKCGFSVLHLHTIGHGCPDILVGKKGFNLLVEIKKDDKAKLTPDENSFFADWKGRVIVASCVEEIISYFTFLEEQL